VVVLDNADDASFLLEQPTTVGEAQNAQRRIDYIPSCEHGSMLITTRSKSEALKLVYESEAIDVLPMTEEEAEALLVSKLGHQSLGDRRLVQALDCLPLAITQAAAYIRERGSRCSVQQYGDEIEQGRASRRSLLRRHVPIPGRDMEASNAVMLTLQISFEHVYRTRKSAAEMLSLMSFCDRLAIPEVLIQECVEAANSLASSSAFEGDIVTLRSFSFVSETTDSQIWEMHRLVQDAIQSWLEDCGRFDGVLSGFVHGIYNIFPTSGFENWSLCYKLFPHAMNVVELKPGGGKSQAEWASLMYNGAWFALEQGDYSNVIRGEATPAVKRHMDFELDIFNLSKHLQ
jgi:hypothetical protein